MRTLCVVVIKFSGVVGLDVPISKLGTEPLEKPYLIVAELYLTFSRVFLEPKQPLMTEQQVVAVPDTPDASRAYLHASKCQLLGHTKSSMGGALAPGIWTTATRIYARLSGSTIVQVL